MKLIMENWRQFRKVAVKEHNRKMDASAQAAYNQALRDDAERGPPKPWHPKGDPKKSPYYDIAMAYIEKVLSDILQDLKSGRRSRKIKAFLKKVSLHEENYETEIYPKIEKWLRSTKITFEADCWGLIYAKHNEMSLCRRFLDPKGFSTNKERWEQMRATLVHEFNHAIDYIWSTEKIAYGAKPRSKDKGLRSTEASLSAQQRELLQLLYNLTIGLSTSEIAAKDAGFEAKGPDQEVPYYHRPIEVFANLQEIFFEVGDITLEDLKLVCQTKGQPSVADKAREKLIKKGWTTALIYKNDFIDNLDCSKLTQPDAEERVRKLNQLASAIKSAPTQRMVAEE